MSLRTLFKTPHTTRRVLFAALFAMFLAFGLAGTVIAPAAAVAQSDLGTITGTVTDSSGAAVTHATVTVTNSATGAQRVGTTNAKGVYTIAELPPADYSISVSASGFETSTQGFTLAVGATREISVKLGVAGAKTEIVVTADSTTAPNLVDGQISTEITNQQIQSMALSDRDPYSLVSLSGNVSGQITGGDRGVGYDMGGARSASVDILLDGAENTDLFTVGVGQNIPLDAVQEFSVVIAGQDAGFGRASGGAVNVATRGGTNQFHGDAYEYNRISTFASDGYNNNALWAWPDHYGLTSPKPRYVHNQFGYFVSGPVKHDKLFFSSATEWTRIRSNAVNSAAVPLDGLISLTASNTQAYFGQYGTLNHQVNGLKFTGAQMQNLGSFSDDITTIAQQETGGTGSSCADASLANAPICKNQLFGIATWLDPGDSGGGTPVNQWINFERIDWNVSDKTLIFGRYTQQSTDIPLGAVSTSPYEGYSTGENDANHGLLLSITHTFSPTLTSATKLLGQRFNSLQGLGAAPVGPTLYINSGGAVGLGGASINMPGYLPTSPGSALPFGGPQNFIQVGEDLAWNKGKHTFKIGGEFMYIKDNRAFGAYENSVDALVQTGSANALINMVNGNLGYVNVAVNPNGVYPCTRDAATNETVVSSNCMIQTPATAPNFTRSNRYKDWALYFTDNFRATSRLSLNAGLRWEVYGPQHSQRASQDANWKWGDGATIYDEIRNGQILTRNDLPDGRLWKLNLNQFGPRLGFAYDLTGNGKSVIRGGYALSFERNFGNVTYNVIQNPPAYAVLALQNVPISTNNLGAFGEDSGPQPLPNTTLRIVDPRMKPVYTENWNLTFEHQLDPGTLVTIGYIGSRGIRNYSITNFNRSFSAVNYLGTSGLADISAYPERLNLQYSNINFRGADGDSYYEALNLGIRSSNMHRTGLSVVANYTYGHSIDNNSSTFGDGANAAGGGFYLGYLDPFNHALDRGPSDFDVRHRVTAGIIWTTPFFKSSPGIVQTLLGGWVAATNFSAETGNPFSMYDCGYAVTVCPRVAFAGARPKKNSNLEDISADWGPNTYSYMDLPAYGTSAYNEWVNPYVNAYYNNVYFGNPNAGYMIAGSDTPAAGETGTPDGGFVHNMDRRNAYYGPGVWGEDFKLSKDFKVRERYGVTLSGTFINVFNHANSYLNLNGYQEVDYVQQELAYKSGNRNVELEAKFVF